MYAILIILAPLAAGVIIGLLGPAIGRKAERVGVAANVVALGVALYVLSQVTAGDPMALQLRPWPGDILQFDLYIDRLSAVLLVHIAALSVLIQIFSIRYMQQERGYARFNSLLNFMTFALFGMVTSGNLLMLFAFWQLLSWLLPLLSHNYAHPATMHGGFRTFIMQRAGDAAFLGGIVVAYHFYQTLDLRQLFLRAAEAQTLLSLWDGGPQIGAATLITFLIFVGAMSKSAQFPLHMWLPDYLYAPTPVTAFLHAGIINAGGFLLTRLAPLYALSSSTLHLVFAVGLLTALLGSSMMLVQSDIKKTLGYSTIGQMGFMIMECGLGAYGLAIFHLIAHGLFKGTIFLNCGYVIHAARQEPRSPLEHDFEEGAEFSNLRWLTGLVATLILPLIIVLAAHGILNIPLRDSQGTVIFLFFGWATSSQAILTLYRLRAVASWKVAVAMLSTLFLVVITYLFAAETFTHFLFPDPAEVARNFRAGALPIALFDAIVTVFALVIILGWILIYAASHGKSFRLPAGASALQAYLYLLLINRLYLDAVSARLRAVFAPAIEQSNGRYFFPAAAAVGLAAAALAAGGLPGFGPSIALLLVVALALPLFPLHGPYVAGVTRAPGYLAVAHAVLLPAAGLYGLAALSSDLPDDVLRAVSVLALFGALYGSWKALGQTRVPDLIAYAGIAFYSTLWWRFAAAGKLPPTAFLYTFATALLFAGILLAWQRLRRRYGNLTLERMHGLARPMPRFAAVFALLVMGGVGLPPFSLFFSQVGLLLQPAAALSPGLAVILLTWFFSSWYLFRMMQRLLFGPHRPGLLYQDLRAAELAYFAALLVFLAVLSFTPPRALQSALSLPDHRRADLEKPLWNR